MITGLITLCFMVVGGTAYMVIVILSAIISLFTDKPKTTKYEYYEVKKERKHTIEQCLERSYNYYVVDTHKLKPLAFTDDYYEAQRLKKEFWKAGTPAMVKENRQ